ncbi:MAG: LacI family DNA-binding transcriptional regulator [Spirochaetaceae bacterium]|nr:LacI family DNA-binding transcriptional regulator [Spirochaetaceae bacterium]
MAKYKKVRLADIAEKLNISVVTVSKALSDKDGVGIELRDKIKKVAEDMGYISKNKNNDSDKTGTVGVLIPSHFLSDSNSFYWTMYNAVAANLLSKGFYCIMEMLTVEDESACRLPSLIAEKRVDGMIILGQVSSDYVATLNKNDSPFVFLDFYNAFLDMDSVVSDNFYDMFLLTSYLIEQGHKKIRFVGSFNSTSSIQDRFMGFMKAMIINNLEVSVKEIINDRDSSGSFIPLELPDAEKMPTAFVCNADITAIRLINLLKEKGFSVPDDVSVVGFDNFFTQDISAPTLTTVAVDFVAMANTAVDIVLRKIAGKHYKHGRNVIGGKILLRNSVKKIF